MRLAIPRSFVGARELEPFPAERALVLVEAPHGLTFGRFAPAGNKVEQCRLAGSVRADNAQPGARLEHQVESAEQSGRRTEPVAHTVELDHLAAQPFRAELQLLPSLQRLQ